jgi:hypothetical protein
MTEDLQQAIAMATSALESKGESDLLVRQFGKINARLLLRDSRGAVSKLHKAHRAVAMAINQWDGSPKSAIRIARSALSYHERMCDLSLLCHAPAIQPSIQRAKIERRRERAAFHRGRRSAPPG